MKNALGLSIQSQKNPGESVYLPEKRRIVIGSSTSCDIRLDDSTVSSIHAILEIDEASLKITVYDLASETGVKVNGSSVVQAIASAGDKIQIGSFVLTIKNQNELERTKEVEDVRPLLLENEADVHSIFDFSSEKQQSLQVVMLYIDTILEVEHFIKKSKVVIGPKAKNDFSIPEVAAGPGKEAGRYELVSMQDGQYTLNLHNSMSGVISHEGKLQTIKDILANSKGAPAVSLAIEDFAKLSMGDISFFINFTPAPPRLKAQRLMARDAVFAKIWFSSLVFTILLMIAMSKMTINPVIEIEQLPERIATVIYKPELLPIAQPEPQPKVQAAPEVEKKVEPPKPKVIKVTPKPPTEKPAPKNPVIDEAQKNPPKIVQKDPPKAAPQQKPAKAKAQVNKAGNEGEGARAKGENGTRGKVDAKPADVQQTKAARPGSGPKNAPANARPGNSQVQDMGVVDVFKNTGGLLNKLLAGGKGVSGAADKLEGYGGFTTKGAGGLGDAGTGSGGGGTSEGLGGLSDKGVGGGKQGKGLGALGTGGNIIGGKGRLVIAGSNGAPEPIVLGAIDSDAIAREIAKHRDEIKYCYEREINSEHPDLAGRVSIRWIIGASGAVTTAAVSSSSIHNVNVEKCVADVIRRIIFPPVRGGGVAEVTYPFVFRPSNK